MARDVREVANAILDIADAERFELTNLSLNKITYFAHAWYLALHSEPLIDSNFEAWQYGPVHPQIYRQLRNHGNKPITSRLTRINLADGSDLPFEVALESDEMDHLEEITKFYGHRSASWLVSTTHEPGAPWDQVWTAGETKPVPGMIIPDEVSKAYYLSKLSKDS